MEYVPCSNRMPGGVIVGDTGLCRCVPVRCVKSKCSSAISSFRLLVVHRSALRPHSFSDCVHLALVRESKEISSQIGSF